MCRKTLRARRRPGLRCGASGLKVKSKNTGRETSGGHCVSSFTLLVPEHASPVTKTKSGIHRKGRNGKTAGRGFATSKVLLFLRVRRVLCGGLRALIFRVSPRTSAACGRV